MNNNFVITAAAWLEILVGSIFLIALEIPCRLLFATAPDGLAVLLGHFAGVALLSLGISCLPSKLEGSRRRALVGLFAFNIGATIFCAWVALATTFRGVLLWPVVILHAAIASAFLPQFLNRNSHSA
jgi:hypothetical protein